MILKQLIAALLFVLSANLWAQNYQIGISASPSSASFGSGEWYMGGFLEAAKSVGEKSQIGIRLGYEYGLEGVGTDVIVTTGAFYKRTWSFEGFNPFVSFGAGYSWKGYRGITPTNINGLDLSSEIGIAKDLNESFAIFVSGAYHFINYKSRYHGVDVAGGGDWFTIHKGNLKVGLLYSIGK